MSPRHLRENAALREKLAAEYVLGTLRGGARRRLDGWMRDDAVLRQTVAEWRDRLYPMAELGPAVQPPPHVWGEIEKRMDPRVVPGAAPRSSWRKLLDNLAFWRGLGIASTALAAILVVVLVTQQADELLPVIYPAASHVATLVDEKAQPVMLISGNPRRRQLTVKVVASPQIAADKSLELWALTPSGAPRSLGVVAADGTMTLPLPEYADPEAAPALAISLEPKGGSPDRNAPSGPILFKGTWVKT